MNTPVQRHSSVADNAVGLPAPVEPLRPLGPRQNAFWVLQQLAPEAGVSNLSIAFRTSRTLRWWPLHAAVNHLVARHAPLRTRFPAVAGVPLRHTSRASDVQVTVEVGAATEDDVTAKLNEAAKVPFDLGAELPLRLHLFQIGGGGSAVLLVVHHVVSDATSVSLLVDELARVYDGIASGSGIPADLRDEVEVAGEPLASPEDSQFWSKQLSGARPDEAVLPWGRPSPARPTFAGATLVTRMVPETVAALTTLRQATGSTENLILLTAFYLSLFRHGAGSDLVVGVPVTSRRAGSPVRVGFQVSTLPLRVVLDPRASFVGLTRQVRDVFLAGAEHASASVEEVLADGGHHSADWRVPLFRYLFNYRPWTDHDVRIAGERPVFPDMLREDSRLDLQFTVIAEEQPPVIMTNYSTEVFDERDVALFVERTHVLLRAAADDPDRPVNELDLLTQGERAALAALNNTHREDRPDRTVYERFAARAQEDPAATALVGEVLTLSYGDLASAAEAMSARLRRAGVRQGDVVALALPRGAVLPAAVLAVWACGACYLPLDPGQPRQRLVDQISDAGVRLVLVEESVQEVEAGAFGEGVVVLTCAGPAGVDDPVGDDVRTGPPGMDDPAYVIYTSGSTGRPRGVVVTHRNLANVVSGFQERLGTVAGDAVLWSTTTAFDISGLELFLPLSVGGRVVVAGPEAQTRPREVLDLVVKHDVAVVQATPTFWRLAVAEAGAELHGRAVLCGGEPMSAALARDLGRTGCRLFNVYGPTETTIWSTAAEIDHDVSDPVPIGRPIANTAVFVADEHGTLLPPGLLGELCIAGAGVGRGYLGRPELTAQRFVSDARWGRYYRTGDLARWTPGAGLELFGRNDRQVKLRGHRIELPEIEAVLRAHADVADAAAVVVGDPQADAELRGFVRAVPAADAGLPARLWQHLRDHLPDYALPSRVTVLEQFPVTPNGKVDHGALRSLGAPASTSAPEPSVDAAADADPELTRRLLALWRNALSRPAMGERDHFFLNGGHSLLAAQLADRIARIVGRDVSVRAIFDHPTPRQLSAALSGRR